MYNSKIFCFSLTLILTIGLIFNTTVGAESVSVSTSNDIYYKDDHVVIFGTVDTVFENLPITIQIYHESNLIEVAQPDVAKDGTFVESFNTNGPVWKDEGVYTARAFYTTTQIAETTFEFYNQAIDKSSAAFPVNIPNSGTFDVGYTIRGGEVTSITMNEERYSILVETSVSSNGNLVLKFPRESFDAQSDGSDETFIVLVSKGEKESKSWMQVEYEEIGTRSDYRTIRIPLEQDDKWVEVIGTYVIPEFGSVVIIILIAAISSVIIISKTKFYYS